MGKVTSYITIEESVAYTQTFQQLRQDNAAYTVDTVNTDHKASLTDSLNIYETQINDRLDMTVIKTVINRNMAQLVNLSIIKILLLGNLKHALSISSRQEFALAVEQFQCIPLTRIMRCRNDNTTIGTTHADSQFCGRCTGITNIKYIKAHAHQCATNHIAYHRTRDTTIATNNNLTRLARDKGGVSRRKLYNIQRIKGITRCTADSSADT